MNVLVAKTAGFCFGVDRAVSRVFEEAEHRTVAGSEEVQTRLLTLGPLIHNPSIVDALQQRGVGLIESPAEVQPGDTVIVRTHGVSAACYAALKKRGADIIDVTCPYVAKIHRIVKKASEEGRVIFIFGHPDHPEVLGIRGHCKKSYVFSTLQELEFITNQQKLTESPVTMVSQTTMNAKEWHKCCEYAKNNYTNIFISDTICKATDERQHEAAELSALCDAMIVIGGKNSSNTRRLFEVCSSRCANVSLVESADELVLSDYSGCKTVGVTAGASTPDYIIKAVCEKIS